MSKNIVLTGFMGAGKSFVSKRLAEMTGRKVISTDDLIELREGRSIKDIFQEQGEEYFRSVERSIIEQVSGQEGVIIDCGGGVILDSLNVENLKKKGVIIYISCSPETILKNITSTKGLKKRPLLDCENPLEEIRSLLNQRIKKYEQADIVIDGNEKTIEDLSAEVLKVCV